MSKGSFDRDLEKQLKNKKFKERFERAERALDISIKLNELIEMYNLTDQQLADKFHLNLQDIEGLKEGQFSNVSKDSLDRIYEIITSQGDPPIQLIYPFKAQFTHQSNSKDEDFPVGEEEIRKVIETPSYAKQKYIRWAMV